MNKIIPVLFIKENSAEVKKREVKRKKIAKLAKIAKNCEMYMNITNKINPKWILNAL